ncbi:MAG TPA: hypothetical protein VJR89_12175 [Polyangiales bacterium]|nr:hypothetical protein [Polyangiales bacterium]
MLTLLDEANATSPFDFTSGLDRYRLEISFEQRSGEDQDDTAALQQRSAFMSRVAACGTRTFMSSAAACITLSRMPLTATIDVYRIDSDGLTTVVQSRTLDAYLSVDGYELTNAQIFSGSYGVGQTNTRLSLSSADGKTFRLAQFSIVDAGLSLEADTM